MWPDYAQLNCRLPSQYRATVIRLSLDVVCAALPCLALANVQQALAGCLQRCIILSVIECSHDKFHSRPRPCKCTLPNDRVAGAAGGPYAGTPFAPGSA